MRTMIISLMAVAFALNVTKVQAQKSTKPFRLGMGLEAGTVIGKFKNVYGFTPGLTLRGSYKTGPGAVTLTTGALVFLPKSLAGEDAKAALQIPVKAGYKMIFKDRFFVMGELGFSNFRQYFAGLDDKLVSVSSTGFTYAPSVGVQLGGVELGLRYEAVSFTGGTLSSALFRFGFNL